jgi:hypothetical protein
MNTVHGYGTFQQFEKMAKTPKPLVWHFLKLEMNECYAL